jgi:hypothetical protein
LGRTRAQTRAVSSSSCLHCLLLLALCERERGLRGVVESQAFAFASHHPNTTNLHMCLLAPVRLLDRRQTGRYGCQDGELPRLCPHGGSASLAVDRSTICTDTASLKLANRILGQPVYHRLNQYPGGRSFAHLRYSFLIHYSASIESPTSVTFPESSQIICTDTRKSTPYYIALGNSTRSGGCRCPRMRDEC